MCTKPITKSTYTFAALFFAIQLYLVVNAITLPPTSYLHSWNQISTLANARQFLLDPGGWTAPRDVVTRLSWVKNTTLLQDRILPFVAYEEFPLYSIVAAKLSRWTGQEVSVCCKLISIFSLLLFLVAVYAVVFQSFGSYPALYATLMLSASFPYLYYGQAVMSDMLMTALLSSGLALLPYALKKSSMGYFGSSVVSFSLACLAKSYALPFAVFLILGAAYKKRKEVQTAKLVIVTVIALIVISAPVLSWHVFTLTQPGHQELSSHSFAAKISTVFSFAWIFAILNACLRYLGNPFSLLLLFFLVRKKFKTEIFRIWWFAPYLIATFIYLVLTADKISQHDYYFLPVMTPLFALLACLIPNGSTYFITFVVCLLVSTGLAWPKTLKAYRPNPDVIECAQEVIKNTKPNEILAT